MALTEADLDKAYAAAFDAIQDRLKARLNRKCCLTFSAFGIDQNKLPIDNLDEVPVPGKIKLHARRGKICGRAFKDFESTVFENPTWLDLCEIAHAQIRRFVGRRHCYLEAADIVDKVGDIPIVFGTIFAHLYVQADHIIRRPGRHGWQSDRQNR